MNVFFSVKCLWICLYTIFFSLTCVSCCCCCCFFFSSLIVVEKSCELISVESDRKKFISFFFSLFHRLSRSLCVCVMLRAMHNFNMKSLWIVVGKKCENVLNSTWFSVKSFCRKKKLPERKKPSKFKRKNLPNHRVCVRVYLYLYIS